MSGGSGKGNSSPLMQGPLGQRLLALICLLCGLGSVWPLLAWTFGVGQFAAWYWFQGAPGLILIAIAGLVLTRSERYPQLQMTLVAGVLGGVAGTILYDIGRMPFLAFGLRLFAPISSYGLLMTNSPHSSAMTEFLGWTYNFENGIGFGIAYAILAMGRRWLWAVPFALILETSTVVTPYADMYNLRGQYTLIAIAYLGHVFYAYGLGTVVRWAGSWRKSSDSLIRPWMAIAAVGLILLLTQQPWAALGAQPGTIGVSAGSVAIVKGQFAPYWTRVRAGQCITFLNRDRADYKITYPGPIRQIPANSVQTFCLQGVGVKLIHLNGKPYSGGFVILDPAG